MGKYLLFALAIIFCQSGQGQRIQLKGGYTTNLSPYYSKTSTDHVDTVELHFILKGSYDSVKLDSNTAHLELAKFNLPNTPRIADSAHLFFPKAAWPGSDKTKDTTVTIQLLTRSIKDTLKNDEAGHLFIKGQKDQFHTLRLTNTALAIDPKYKPNKSFWVEVGANFDLIDGMEPNNFFSGVFLYKRDIRPLHFSKERRREKIRDKNLAVFAGVFESKSITQTTEENFSLRPYYDSTSLQTGRKDTMQVYRGIGHFTNRRTVRNVGLFFSPQLRLTNGNANEDGFHVFASLWMELQWQKIVEDKEFKQVKNMDTSFLPIETVLTSNEYNTPNSKKETDLRSHYFGLGLPIFLRETVNDNTVHLFVNPILGFSNQPTGEYLNRMALVSTKNPEMPRRQWSPYYVIQFRLNEEAYGISFTGEVRGLLKTNNPPIVSLALSKKFDLTKFMEFNK